MGQHYRLLSESEWEYVARAGTTGKYVCGNSYYCLDGVAWYDSYLDNNQRETHPVGRKEANNFGVHDMQGNVYEWVEDCKGSYSKAPRDGSARTGSNYCRHRALRGGSFRHSAGALRIARRYGDDAGHRSLFRLARKPSILLPFYP